MFLKDTLFFDPHIGVLVMGAGFGMLDAGWRFLYNK